MRSIGRKLSESKCEQSVKFHDALDAGSMSTAAKRRASTCVMVTSSVFGLVGLGVRIPAYRLSGDTTLPGLGAVQAHWRQHLGQAAIEALDHTGCANALLVHEQHDDSDHAVACDPSP